MMTDPIADFLTRIRNISSSGRRQVEAPSSGMKKAIAAILKREGYVRDFEYIPDSKQGILKIYLKPNTKEVLTGLKRISKPGLRVYVGKDDLPRVLGGLVSRSFLLPGLMTDHERRAGLGGEVVCYVW